MRHLSVRVCVTRMHALWAAQLQEALVHVAHGGPVGGLGGPARLHQLRASHDEMYARTH